MLEIGAYVDGKYKVLNMIGQGGMSIVYLAMNERANKQWAIKEIRKEGHDSHDIVMQGLITETELLKRLHHPNLPSIIDVIDTTDSLLIVMDYIEGVTLGLLLREYGAQSQEDVVQWAKQLVSVLLYLHSRNPSIIYRDMKPSNIMLQPDDTIKVIDFGTAREFKPGRVDDTVALGTQGYAAPEQFGIHQTDARTDIYSLGATMYHLVTGHNPSEPPYFMYPIRHWLPELSSGLESIILKCTQRDPANRYQSAAELLFDLEHYQELDLEQLRVQNRKLRIFLVSLALMLVSLISMVGFALAENNQRQNTYSALLIRAQEAYGQGIDSATQYYIEAAGLDPSRPEAYQQLLGLIKQDQVLTRAEDEQLRRFLNESNGTSQSNLEAFQQRNQMAYEQFVYDLGIAYFFTFEGGFEEGQNKAQRYLLAAAQATNLDEQRIHIAQKLFLIAEHPDVFSHSSGLGALLSDETYDTQQFWDDLIELSSESTITQIDNSYIAIHIYNYIVTIINKDYLEFSRSGISIAMMEEELALVETGLNVVETSSADEQELINTTLTSVRLTRSLLMSADTHHTTPADDKEVSDASRS